MKNGLYSSFDMQPCNYGSEEIQMPPLPFSDICSSACEGSFFSGSQLTSDHQHLGTFQTPFHFPGSAEERTPQSFISDTEAIVSENDTKRMMEYERTEERINMKQAKMKNNCLPSQERLMSETRAKKVNQTQVKKSQKISDKIAILQNLASPYGKTDTASVLQEAYTYIKYLQEQIEIFSAPYFLQPLQSQGIQSSKVDLRSRGLSLVPVSFTEKLPKADQLQHSATRRPTLTMKY